MANRQVTLTPEQHAAAEAWVATGEYPDITAVITEALDQLEFRIEAAKLRQRALDAAIEEGERDIREGRYTSISSDADLEAFMRSVDRQS
jgi:Arc/MetJ-type ribon-helix-helix transcriptional regulator